MVYYTVGAKEIYDDRVSDGTCIKAIGGSVFKTIEDAKKYNNVTIKGVTVPSSIYQIEGEWSTDVADPTLTVSKLIKPMKVFFLVNENISKKIIIEDADKRIFPTFCFLIAGEKTDKLKKLIETRILLTDFGIGKGDNLTSINSILNEMEMILNDSTDFIFTKRHAYSSVMWSMERAFMGEPVFQDFALTQDVSKEGINDLLPKKKISINIKGCDPIKAGGNFYSIANSYEFVKNNELFGLPLAFDYGVNCIWAKKEGVMKKYDY